MKGLWVYGFRCSRNSILASFALMLAACLLLCSCNAQNSANTSIEAGDDSSDIAATESANSDNDFQAASNQGKTVADYNIGFNEWIQSMFSDGVAWVKASSAWADRYTLCPILINADGNVLIDCSDDVWDEIGVPLSTSNYCNGVCLINTSDSYCSTADYLIDKSGNVVWSVAEDGQKAAEKYFGSAVVNSIRIWFSMRYNTGNQSSSDGWYSNFYGGDWFNGYTVVEFDISTYEESGTKYGVLDSVGNWVIEPNEDDYMMGSYSIVTPNYEIVFKTGQITKYQTLSTESTYTTKSEFCTYFDNLEAEGYLEAHDGLILDYIDDRYVFVDGNERIVIDLSSYNDIKNHETAEFSNGFCSLIVSGKDGNGSFVTVIDVDGNELFEPTAFDNLFSSNDTAYSECALAVDGSYFDANGYQLGSVEADRCREFTDGRAWVMIDSELHCLNEKGEVVF